MHWVGHDIPFIRQRYNRISAYYRIFECTYWLPRGIRRGAINRLKLKPGEGCSRSGTGRNLAYLRDSVSDSGRMYGVDLDGKRFLIAVPVEERNSPPITVVLNWARKWQIFND